MPHRERAVDRGTRRSRNLIAEVSDELRQARRAAGLTQRAVADACGIAPSYVSQIERGRAANVSVRHLSRVASVVGLDLTIRLFPGPSPLRDAGHLALLDRLRARLGPDSTWRAEVPLPNPGDLRAWDAMIVREGRRVAIEAETRITDLQALLRRLGHKRRDGLVDHLVLLVADTRLNRAIIRDHRSLLFSEFPVAGPAALRRLVDGCDPGGSAVIVL